MSSIILNKVNDYKNQGSKNHTQTKGNLFDDFASSTIYIHIRFSSVWVHYTPIFSNVNPWIRMVLLAYLLPPDYTLSEKLYINQALSERGGPAPTWMSSYFCKVYQPIQQIFSI